MTHIRGRPRHPETQSQVERFNRTLKSRTRKALGSIRQDWATVHTKVVYQYNNSVHRATGFKPFVLLKGIDLQDLSPKNTVNIEEGRSNYSKYIIGYKTE